MKRVFIDGQVGTTGIHIHEQLKKRHDIQLVEIEDAFRKDPVRKKALINDVDLVVLCLPDTAAKETVALIDNPNVHIVDASTAHRVDPQWTYGFPELGSEWKEKIKNARLVSNPGCHATGAIALLHPLVTQNILPTDYPVSITSLTGYSGAGKAMISTYQDKQISDRSSWACRPYALGLTHKHIPEICKMANLDFAPIFYPVVGDFERGMLVSIGLETRLLKQKITPRIAHEIISKHYSGEPFIRVIPLDNSSFLEDGFLVATECNETNRLDIFVTGHEEQILLVARLDNLGKGASGAAIQNMNLMLGLDETAGLISL